MEAFAELFGSATFSDFSIRTPSGEAVPVHRAVISRLSKYFRGLFATATAEKEAGVAEFSSVPVPSDVFKSVIGFLYGKEVPLSDDNLVESLYVAKFLMIELLEQKCMEFFEENLSVSTAVPWLEASVRLDLAELERRIVAFVKEKFREFEGAQLLRCPVDSLISILSADDLKVNAELDVLRTCLQYCEESGRDIARAVRRKLFSCVRYAFLPSETLGILHKSGCAAPAPLVVYGMRQRMLMSVGASSSNSVDALPGIEPDIPLVPRPRPSYSVRVDANPRCFWHIVKVEQFASKIGTIISTQNFCANGNLWKLKLHKGHSSNPDHLGIFLVPVKLSATTAVECTIALARSEEELRRNRSVPEMTFTRSFADGGNAYGFPEFEPLSTLGRFIEKDALLIGVLLADPASGTADK